MASYQSNYPQGSGIELESLPISEVRSDTSSFLQEISPITNFRGSSIHRSSFPTCQKTIVDIITGHTVSTTIFSNNYSKFYLELLNNRVRRFSNSDLAKKLFPRTTFSVEANASTNLAIFKSLVVMADALDIGTATIHDIANQLLEIIGSDTVTLELYQFVFKGISLISLLFDVDESISQAKFQLVLQPIPGANSSSSHSQQSSVWQRLSCPITDENGGSVHIDIGQLLSHFGHCIPIPCVRPLVRPKDLYEDVLVASNLNYYALSKIGKLKIEWVESLSLHLDLHERSSKLRLFAYPSFCALLCQRYEKQDTFLSKVLSADNAYTYDFLTEVLCTYRLIFGQNQNFYKTLSIPSQVVSDPLLKILCNRSSKKHEFYSSLGKEGSKSQYTTWADFPLLGQRLLTLQAYMNECNPSDLRTLWHDRRDVLKFYTFWAVFVVGGLGILISALSLGLAAIQTTATITYTYFNFLESSCYINTKMDSPTDSGCNLAKAHHKNQISTDWAKQVINISAQDTRAQPWKKHLPNGEEGDITTPDIINLTTQVQDNNMAA